MWKFYLIGGVVLSALALILFAPLGAAKLCPNPDFSDQARPHLREVVLCHIWLDPKQWQPLISGIVALIAGVLAASAIVYQVWEQRRSEAKRAAEIRNRFRRNIVQQAEDIKRWSQGWWERNWHRRQITTGLRVPPLDAWHLDESFRKEIRDYLDCQSEIEFFYAVIFDHQLIHDSLERFDNEKNSQIDTSSTEAFIEQAFKNMIGDLSGLISIVSKDLSPAN